MGRPGDSRFDQTIGAPRNADDCFFRFQSQAADCLNRLDQDLGRRLNRNARRIAFPHISDGGQLLTQTPEHRIAVDEEHPKVTVNRIGVHVPIVLNGLLDPILRTAIHFWPERLLNSSWCRHFIILALSWIWEQRSHDNEGGCDNTLLEHPHPQNKWLSRTRRLTDINDRYYFFV